RGRLARAERCVLRELSAPRLPALGDQLIAQAEAQRDLERLPGTAVLRGRGAELGQPLAELGDAARRGVPAVAQRDDPTERGRARATDPDRWMRLLHGPRREAEIAETNGVALEARCVRRPQLLEHAQRLVAPATASVEGRAEDLELLLPPAHADAADEASVRQGVDAREHLGHEHRMAM